MEAVWIEERVDLLNDSGRQWIFRPNGPPVVLQAQRAGRMDAGGQSPLVAEPPTLLQAQRAESVMVFFQALNICRRLLCQPFGLFPSGGANEPWLDEPRQPLYRPSGPKQPKTVNPLYLSGQ